MASLFIGMTQLNSTNQQGLLQYPSRTGIILSPLNRQEIQTMCSLLEVQKSHLLLSIHLYRSHLK